MIANSKFEHYHWLNQWVAENFQLFRFAIYLSRISRIKERKPTRTHNSEFSSAQHTGQKNRISYKIDRVLILRKHLIQFKFNFRVSRNFWFGIGQSQFDKTHHQNSWLLFFLFLCVNPPLTLSAQIQYDFICVCIDCMRKTQLTTISLYTYISSSRSFVPFTARSLYFFSFSRSSSYCFVLLFFSQFSSRFSTTSHHKNQ